MVSGAGLDGSQAIIPKAGDFRNEPPAGGTREDLAAKVDLAVGGANSVGQRVTGKVAGRDVFIGEAATDHMGRLVVLGGHGVSNSWTNPPSPLDDYLNNPGWYDDVADGPVDATLTFAGRGGSVQVDEGAWVVVGPPDFAPDVTPIVTLYDIMADRLGIAVPPAISFVDDVLPILERVASHLAVNRLLEPTWRAVANALANNLASLSDPSDASDALRASVHATVLKATELRELRFTKSQKEILDDWRDGAFLAGSDPARTAPTEADMLDELALSRTVGGGFFPGIEAGFMLTYGLYAGKARLTRGDFEDFDGQRRRLQPGAITERMAVPWQADFSECQARWWPAQRPDVARFGPDGQALPPNTRWDRLVAVAAQDGPIAHNRPSRMNMVAHFAKLGVVEKKTIGGVERSVETGRAPDAAFTAGG
jgi:hypothetical protein